MSKMKDRIEVKVGQVWESRLDGVRYKIDCNYGHSVGMIGTEGAHHHVIESRKEDLLGPNWKLVRDV